MCLDESPARLLFGASVRESELFDLTEVDVSG
jgi:hypothetical protein